MTYIGFLFVFLIPPMLILLLIAFRDQARGKTLPDELRSAPPWLVIFILTGIAVIYTTPWDNYLVATRVWWYDPLLVAGIMLGWVPLEEYIFFILQTSLAGLLTITLARHTLYLKEKFVPNHKIRSMSAGVVLILWLCAGAAFIFNFAPAAYASLLLLWALPPIALQLVFGGDILWHYRKLTGLAILFPTVYLSLADSLAIRSGTWTINPSQSLNTFIVGLPVEELLFFLCTNTLVVFGVVLAISVHGNARLGSTISQIHEVKSQEKAAGQDYFSR